MYDLIIIGGGPSGIAAGIYAVRQNIKTLLIAKGFGGQVARKTTLVENYPGFPSISGLDLIQKFTDHLRKLKVEILTDSVVQIKKPRTDFILNLKSKKTLKARAVIIASGADPRPLELPGEKKFIGRGVSYCTTCDGPLFAGKTVAVAGGGNSGFEAALFLTDIAREVYILESGSKVRAAEANQRAAEKKGVKVITSALLKRIEGGDFVDSLVYQDQKTKKLQSLKTDGLFVEIGSQPATSFAKELVDFNSEDEIKINPRTCQTKTSGLFASGDVTDVRDKQIIVAAGEGVKAFLSARRYLKNL